MPEPDDRLPRGATAYKRSAVFTAATLPPALQHNHTTKQGCWALLHILAGALTFIVDDPGRPFSSTELRPGLPPGLIEPTISHRVALKGPVAFQLEFYREAHEGASS